MIFRQFIREETGCASYLVASSEVAQAAVFDPLWDIEPYLEFAREKDLQITHVIDSHSHADHVSGARRLAGAAGAELVLPEAADVDYPARTVVSGDRIELGEIELEVLAAPGHRPEQINLLVRDRSRGPEPWCVLTADFLLVGDVARPDLAQPGEEGAATLFREAIPAILELPDHVEVYPGHLAGST